MKKLSLLLLIVLIVPCACSSPPPATGSIAGAAEVRVVITRDFGSEVLLEKSLVLSGQTSALDALKQVAQVETAYGGGFVKGINGLNSEFKGPASSKKDWFVFINGMLANTGAVDYILQPGDIEQWDFHTWSFQQSVPAITGSFPQPFSGGYAGRTRPTFIVYEEGFRDQAAALEKFFTASGIQNVSLTDFPGLTAKQKQEGNLILIAAPANALINELERNWRKLGFFAHWENGQIVTLDAAGKPGASYGPGTGWIQATQNPWNPNGTGADENVVWLVSGTDRAGVNAAASGLSSGKALIKYAYAILIAGDQAIAGNQAIRLPR